MFVEQSQLLVRNHQQQSFIISTLPISLPSSITYQELLARTTQYSNNMADLPLYTSDIHQAVKIRMGSDGFSALEPKTVMQYFDEVVAKHGDKPALYEKVPVKVCIDRNDTIVWLHTFYHCVMSVVGGSILARLVHQ